MGVTNLDALTLTDVLKADLDTADQVLEVTDVASGGVLAVHTTQVMTHSIRIKSADGTLYYIMVTDAATNRTGGA